MKEYIDGNMIKMEANSGYLLSKLSENEVKPIKDEIEKIKKDFSLSIPVNNKLAGNIQYEFSLIDSHNYINNLVLDYINAHSNVFMQDFNQIIETPCKLELGSSWVNFQKKYEFNPPHDHSGVYSFVLWIEMPFNIEDEMKNCSSINSKFNIPAHFIFLYTDANGRIKSICIPADKKYENVLCVFPARMIHMVTPFYTSDKYRISVSGNFCYKAIL